MLDEKTNIDFPFWICRNCAELEILNPTCKPTWYEGICDLCNKITHVTLPRNFKSVEKIKT